MTIISAPATNIAHAAVDEPSPPVEGSSARATGAVGVVVAVVVDGAEVVVFAISGEGAAEPAEEPSEVKAV